MVHENKENGGVLISLDPEKVQEIATFNELLIYTKNALAPHEGKISTLLSPCVMQCHVDAHIGENELLSYHAEILSAHGKTILDLTSFHQAFTRILNQKENACTFFPHDIVHDFLIPLVQEKKMFETLFFTENFRTSFSIELAHDTAISLGIPVYEIPW